MPPKPIADAPIATCAYRTTSASVSWPAVSRRHQRPEHRHVGQDDEQDAPEHGLLSQSRRLVLEGVQLAPAIDERVEDPVTQTEEPHLFGRRRIDSKPIEVVRLAMRAAHDLGVAIVPYRAFPQPVVRGEPRPAEEERRPPRVERKHQHRRQTDHHLHDAGCNEVHRDRQWWTGHAAIEVARGDEIARERRVFEMTDAGRLDARVGQTIVEPGRGAVAEVGAERAVNRGEDLQQDEGGTDERQRSRERRALLNGTHKLPHSDREASGKHAAKKQDTRPDRCQRRIGAKEGCGQLRGVPLAEALKQ